MQLGTGQTFFNRILLPFIVSVGKYSSTQTIGFISMTMVCFKNDSELLQFVAAHIQL